MVSTLAHLPETSNQYVYIGSFTICQNDILAALEKAGGKQEWKVEKHSARQKVQAHQERVARGERRMTRALVTAATFSEGTGCNFEEDEVLSNEVLGLKPENLEEVVMAVVEGKLP